MIDRERYSSGEHGAPYLIFPDDAHAWRRLESALEKSGTADPVRPVALCNPDEQLSYCTKLVTYHQPGRRRVPLPRDRLGELADQKREKPAPTPSRPTQVDLAPGL